MVIAEGRVPNQTTSVDRPITLSFKNGPTVHRLGLGAMRITGPGVWGPPCDESEAIALLRHAVDKGVSFIDTADSHGPRVSETLIAKALYPYLAGLVIASKRRVHATGSRELGRRLPAATSEAGM